MRFMLFPSVCGMAATGHAWQRRQRDSGHRADCVWVSCHTKPTRNSGTLFAVMLPDTDGFEVVRRLRQDGCGVPVIFLTARDTEADKVAGLTIGGDDYMTKPFGLEELAARVRTVLRRTRGPGAAGTAPTVLVFEDLELDQDSYEVRRDGHLVELSPTEFRLLRYLMLHPGRVLTRAQLLDHVWDYGGHGSTTVVAPYVAYLRRKLARYGPDLIHTQRAVGYSLRPPRAGETGPGGN